MTPYLLTGAAITALLSAGYGYVKHQQVEGLRSELAFQKAQVVTLTAARDIAEAAAELEAERAEKAEDRAADVQAAIEILLTGDLDNAEIPVDPRLADYLDCLRTAGTGGADCAGTLSGDPAALPDQ